MLTVLVTSNVGGKSRNGRQHRYTVYFKPQIDGTYPSFFR
jgi:hypothetical protein